MQIAMNSSRETGSRQNSLPGQSLSLEDLAEDSRLIPEIFHQELRYDNPTRDKEVFYEFVREYAGTLGFTVKDNPLNRKNQLMLGFVLDNINYILLPTAWLDAMYVFGGTRGMITCSDTSTDDREIVVGFPEPVMLGRLYARGDTKLHEYLHAYHFLVAEDLKRQGLSSNGFLDWAGRERITPQTIYRAPRSLELKKFERRIIKSLTGKISFLSSLSCLL